MDGEMEKKRAATYFKKGWKGGPGRPKGSKAVVTDLREMFLAALDKAGGIEYLRRKAGTNPGPFMAALSKMLPQTVKMDTTFKPQWPELPATEAGKARAADALLKDRLTAIPKGGNDDGNGN